MLAAMHRAAISLSRAVKDMAASRSWSALFLIDPHR